MKKGFVMVVAALGLVLLASCGEKKKSEDIIAQRVIKVKPKAPVKMQEYNDERDVEWIGKSYHVAVHRQPADSLPMVKDETGQKFVDNRISLRVLRSDGSVFFSRVFTKAAFDAYLDNDYRQTGILEGLVFDRVEGANLFFAASVSHPQTDEYIPMVLSVSSQGEIGIRRDTDLDTNGGDNAPSTNTNDEDEV